MNGAPEQDPRVYFAAERTFLAWIRTGLGLMGVGFAVARFGLFLREMRSTGSHGVPGPVGVSLPSGVAIVVLGVLVLVAAVVQHATVVRQLREGTWQPGRTSVYAVVLALLLAVVGSGMAVYLLLIR